MGEKIPDVVPAIPLKPAQVKLELPKSIENVKASINQEAESVAINKRKRNSVPEDDDIIILSDDDDDAKVAIAAKPKRMLLFSFKRRLFF